MMFLSKCAVLVAVTLFGAQLISAVDVLRTSTTVFYNPVCPTAHSFKIEEDLRGIFTQRTWYIDPAQTYYITLNNVKVDNGYVGSWSSNVAMDKIIVKGGANSAAIWYNYTEETMYDNVPLYTYVNPVNKKNAAISHVTFCFDFEVTSKDLTYTAIRDYIYTWRTTYKPDENCQYPSADLCVEQETDITKFVTYAAQASWANFEVTDASFTIYNPDFINMARVTSVNVYVGTIAAAVQCGDTAGVLIHDIPPLGSLTCTFSFASATNPSGDEDPKIEIRIATAELSRVGSSDLTYDVNWVTDETIDAEISLKLEVFHNPMDYPIILKDPNPVLVQYNNPVPPLIAALTISDRSLDYFFIQYVLRAYSVDRNLLLLSENVVVVKYCPADPYSLAIESTTNTQVHPRTTDWEIVNPVLPEDCIDTNAGGSSSFDLPLTIKAYRVDEGYTVDGTFKITNPDMNCEAVITKVGVRGYYGAEEGSFVTGTIASACVATVEMPIVLAPGETIECAYSNIHHHTSIEKISIIVLTDMHTGVAGSKSVVLLDGADTVVVDSRYSTVLKATSTMLDYVLTSTPFTIDLATEMNKVFEFTYNFVVTGIVSQTTIPVEFRFHDLNVPEGEDDLIADGALDVSLVFCAIPEYDEGPCVNDYPYWRDNPMRWPAPYNAETSTIPSTTTLFLDALKYTGTNTWSLILRGYVTAILNNARGATFPPDVAALIHQVEYFLRYGIPTDETLAEFAAQYQAAVVQYNSGLLNGLPICARCTYTQGYWKNHLGNGFTKPNMWPADYGTTREYFTHVIPTDDTSPHELWKDIYANHDDATVCYWKVSHQFIAATLNVAAGARTTTVVDASMTYVLGKLVSYAHNPAGLVCDQELLDEHDTLDMFNNGLIEGAALHCPA